MIGAPKGLSGGFGITSLPRSSPTEVGKAVQDLKGAFEGLKSNPLFQKLMGDSFESHGKGHAKHAGKAEKAEKAEGKDASPEDALKKLVEGLKKFVEQLEEMMGKKGAKAAAPSEEEEAKDPISKLLETLKKLVEQLQQMQQQMQAGNQNPGIVPPAGNTGIVPSAGTNTGIVPPAL
jgi:ElaB/YqjD/DUF883 family membrane-anchored ribosome-binding protein